MGHHGHNNKPLGLMDVIAGFISFMLVAFFMRWLITNGIPGLLKEQTFYQILQAGCLFLLVWGLFLNNLFKKYVDVLELRESRSTGAEAEAAKIRSQVKELNLKIEQELQEERIAALTEAEGVSNQARRRAAQMIEEANQVADGRYEESQLKIEEIQTKARGELNQEAAKLAQHFKDCALKPTGQTIH